MKLIVLDMDGVIFEHRNFWLELHKALGTHEEGIELTKKYLHTDYQKLVEEVVGKLWRGKNAQPYHNLITSINYIDGVQELFQEIKRQDLIVAIISSGAIDLARRAQHDLGIDFIYANELVIRDNIITGEFVWPLAAGNEKKVQILKHLCQDLEITPEEVMYVGDDDSDLHAFEFVGTSIAFNTKSEELKQAATHVVEEADLQKIIPFLKNQTL